MKRVLILLFLFTTLVMRAQSAAEKYIEKYDSLALEVLYSYEIPASLVLGIALQESGAGTSKLCRINKNHFGVKGRTKSAKTKSGYSSQYRTFESDEAAYLHFGQMLSKKKYYSTLKGNMNYMKWLKAMKAANYATSPHWVSHVEKMIKRYNLTRYDKINEFPFLTSPSGADSLKILKSQ